MLTGRKTYFEIDQELPQLPQERVKCPYCGRYGYLGTCLGCGAPNVPDRQQRAGIGRIKTVPRDPIWVRS